MTSTLYGKNIKPDTNIFRQAKQLRQEKPVLEMNEEELEIVKIVTMSLLLLRHFSDIPIDDGLEELAKLVEEGKSHAPQKAPPQASHISGAKEGAQTKRASLVGKRR